MRRGFQVYAAITLEAASYEKGPRCLQRGLYTLLLSHDLNSAALLRGATVNFDLDAAHADY